MQLKIFCRFLPLLVILLSHHLIAGSVSIVWTANPEKDLAGYRIYRTQSPGTGYVPVNTSLAATPCFTDTTAVPGGTYYYAVTAVNYTGQESPKSSEVKATVPTSKNSAFVFPAHTIGIDPSLDSTFVGVAVLNTAATANLVEITAMNSSGAEQPVTSSIYGPSVQSAFLTASLPGSAPPVVAFKAKGAQEGLRGFFLVGDGQPNRLDGVGGKLPPATSLFFPIAAESTGGRTVLFLTNPDPSQGADLSFALVNPQGQPIGTASLTLAPGTSRLAALTDLLPLQPFSGDYYLRLNANNAVQGFELLADTNEFWSSSAQVPVPTKALWIPHFVLGLNGEDTELRLINVESQPISARLKVYDDSATLLKTRDLLVPAGGLLVDRLSNILGPTAVPPFQPFLTGHMVIDVLTPSAGGLGILGTATFTGPFGKARSTLPMWRQPRMDSLYLQVAQSAAQDVFTGLAIMNPNSTTVSVIVRVFAKNGSLTGERTLQIGAGQRVVDLLNGSRLFGPAFQQTEGHMTVTGNQPIVSFVVFGDSYSRYLAAVEGQ